MCWLFVGAHVQAIFDMAVQGNFVSTEYACSIFLTVVTKENIVAKAANGNYFAVGGMATGKLRLQGRTSSAVLCC